MDQQTLDSVTRKLKIVDLCCGAGMATVGMLEAGGFEADWGVDSWEEAMDAYSRNTNREGFLTACSVEEAAWEMLDSGPPPDVVLTGPPCQDDSRANQKADKGRGAVKSPALDAALANKATWIIMEMVTSQWTGWCKEQGARQILKLRDCEVGGHTSRDRWFAIWGPRDLEIAKETGPGWGVALGIDDPEARLGTESNNNSKRWKYAKAPHEPAGACVGGDRRHVLKLRDGTTTRLTAEQEARLSGFQGLVLGWTEDGCRFGARNDREANTMVGNGWPKAFGLAIGKAIMKAMSGRNPDRQPILEGWYDLDPEWLHEQAVTARPKTMLDLPASTF